MPGSSNRDRHNGRVDRLPPRHFTRAPAALLGSLLALALLVSGCGAQSGNAQHPAAPKPKPSVALPTGDVSVPPGVKITPPGTKLSFGQSATVAYEPNSKRNTVLRLTVTRVRRARISDLSAYVLDRRTRNSTPYYVDVDVRNVGGGDVGRTDVPVWLVDQDNTLIHSSGFTNKFAACPSTPLPKRFGPHAKLSTCLLYLVPGHGSFTAMSFRPLQAYAPITWAGQVQQPKSHKTKQHAAKQHKANQHKKSHEKHGKNH
jgi:hypothetical protein